MKHVNKILPALHAMPFFFFFFFVDGETDSYLKHRLETWSAV